MPEVLNIPGSARLAAGAFVSGAALVGLAWVLTSRSPMPPPPDPEPVVLWPSEQDQHAAIPTENHAQTDSARLTTPAKNLDALDTSKIIIPKAPDFPTLIPIDPEPERVALPQSPINPSGPSVAAPSVVEPKPKPKQAPGSAAQLVAINSAGFAELQMLPRIGPVLAQRIIDDRDANGAFTSLKDLQRVKGIGEKTASKLEPLIVFE